MSTSIVFSDKFQLYNESIESLPFDDLFALYETILSNSCTSDVERVMMSYVTSVIEPVGWKAIWIRSKYFVGQWVQEVSLSSDCDFLVEVHDVSLKKLQATVTILETLYDTQKLEGNVDSGSELETTLYNSCEVDVPLVQLFPLRDEEGLYKRTANTIQTVSHIWRPWDDDDDDVVFAEKHLGTRLKFYFEQQSGSLPEVVECRIRELLSEASEIRMRLNNVQGQMDLSDSDEELDERDVDECIQLRYRMDVLQREVETHENPLLRKFVIKKDLPHRNLHKNEPATRLVADKITFGMIMSIAPNEDTLLEIHHSLEEALTVATSGDTIKIFPGVYKTGPLPWFEHDLSIKGVSGGDRVILEASEGCGELFLSCGAQNLHLYNLELVPSSSMMSTIMVHEGSLTMNNCIVRGAKHCLVVLADGKASLENCTFADSKEDGIQLRSGAKVSFEKCSVHNCQGNGLSLDAPHGPSHSQTQLSIRNSQVNENGKYGLKTVCPRGSTSPQDSFTWDYFKSFPWLDLDVDTVNCTNNKSGELGLSYKDAPKSVPSPPDNYRDFLNSISLKPQFTLYDE